MVIERRRKPAVSTRAGTWKSRGRKAMARGAEGGCRHLRRPAPACPAPTATGPRSARSSVAEAAQRGLGGLVERVEAQVDAEATLAPGEGAVGDRGAGLAGRQPRSRP